MPSSLYPSGETVSPLASVSFLNALQDTSMLEATSLGSGMLFPGALFDIRLGGDAAMVGSNRSVQLPISKTILTVGRPYGMECGYAPADPADVASHGSDQDLWVPFTVWTMTDASQDDVEARLLFARDHRQNVFSAYGLNLQVGGMVGARPRPQSPVTGLSAVDYRWRFFYSRS